MIYNIKKAEEFIWYIGNLLSQKKEGKHLFFIRFVFIGDGQSYFNLKYIYLKTFTFRSLLNKVVPFERVTKKFTIEENMLRQQHANH